MRNLFASLAFRLMGVHVVLFTLLAFALLGVNYWMTIHTPYHNIKARVLAEATSLAGVHDTLGIGALKEELEARLAAGGARRPFHALIAADGQVITSNLVDWPSRWRTPWLRLDADSHQDGESQDIEPLLRDRVFSDGTRLLVGRDIEDIDELEEKLLSVALGVTVSAMALGLLGGWLVSRAVARRIGAVTRIAGRVMDGDLSSRIALTGQSDDFDSLYEVLNQMLARIDNLVESVRRVSDSVAHELRTPLARLRATLESLARPAHAVTAAQIEELLAHVESLEKTFDAVLRIARIENASAGPLAPRLDLAPLVRDAAELYAPAAEERGLRLQVSVQQSLAIRGDRDLLFQSLCNLIDNAIKYTPSGGQVSIGAALQGDVVEVSISDTGPGISEEHRPRVTERFYRVPATAATPGTGLGLSLVAAVASRHQSQLLFEDAAPGLDIRWRFPVA